MPKRPARQKAPRVATGPWTVRPASARAQKEWNQATAAEPELMSGLRERLRLRTLDRSDNPNRTHQLKPPLAEKVIGGKRLPQWQHELSSSGRVFYCPDRTDRVVWVTKVELAHPKETD